MGEHHIITTYNIFRHVSQMLLGLLPCAAFCSASAACIALAIQDNTCLFGIFQVDDQSLHFAFGIKFIALVPNCKI